MFFRERALPRHRGHHGNLREFGELNEFLSGIRVHHALSRMNDRIIGVQQCFGRGLNVGRIPRCCSRLDRTVAVHDVVRYFGGRHVSRNLDHHGPGPASLECRECSTHRIHYALGNSDLLNLLGNRGIALKRAVMREYAGALPGMT